MNAKQAVPKGKPVRRRMLQDIQVDQVRDSVNPGLWFNKYLGYQPQKKNVEGVKDPLDAYFSLVGECATFSDSPAYKAFFARWRHTLEKDYGARTREISAEGFRLAIGLGHASVIENGFTFHHTYGVPIIPGSSLKGLARSYAANQLAKPWQRDGDAHKTLFGTTESAGYVTFFDALPLPGSWKMLPDVVTVHHQAYYQGKDEPKAPTDWDNPIPISFMSATGTFLLPLAAPPGAESWVDAAFGILDLALIEEGVGGKTSSGYGRLNFLATEAERAEAARETALGAIRRSADALTPASFAGGIGQVAAQLLDLDLPDAEKRPFANELLQRIVNAGRDKKSAGKGWYERLKTLASGDETS